MSSNLREKINVYCRFCPLNEKEKNINIDKISDFASGNSLTFQEKNIYKFNYDKIFHSSSTQEEVYDYCAKNIIKDIFKGYNGSIILYGQQSSGKNYTLLGIKNEEEKKGLIPRMIKDIFNYIYNSENIEFILKLSMFEINQEKIVDLIHIDKNKNKNLNIKQDNLKGINIEGLSEHYISTPEEIFDLLEIANNNKIQSLPNINEHSEQSHFIFILKLLQNNKKDGNLTMSKLILVNLGGTMKLNKSSLEGQILEKEQLNNNNSLNILKQYINNLANGKNFHIPLKENKLTKILKECFGGNFKTNIIL